MSHLDRVIVLVDMDCFYCQVEEKLNPSLKGKPMAVVQYNAWKGGGIIAVNYAARSRGVTRHMRGDEAKRKCPEIELVKVPCVREKADLTKYRDAGKEVAKVLQRFTSLVERASVDEAYLDITQAVKDRNTLFSKEIPLNDVKNTHIVACDIMDFLYNIYNSGLHLESNLRLAIGAVIVEEIRAAVFNETGYTCSAGIAHNKILAKLACGLNKPNKQTILPQDNVSELYKNLPVCKIRSLGGKFGNTLSEDLGITTMAELYKFSEKELSRRYDEKTASFLYNIARGINHDPVTVRLIPKSIGCCKKFAGIAALTDEDSIKYWLNELSVEVIDRLEKDLEENNRKAKQIVVSFSQDINGKEVANSRTNPLHAYDPSRIASDAYEVVKKHCLKPNGNFCIKYLGFNVGKFEDCKNVNEITAFFKCGTSFTAPKVNCEKIKEENKTKLESEELCNLSDSTVDANEDSSEFTFLNQNGNTSDNDSITMELSTYNSEKPVEDDPEKHSFFLRYFENLKKQNNSPPVPRDFNTSKNLESEEDEESVEGDDNQEPSTSTGFIIESDTCRECNKKIPRDDMVSHTDYHLALRLSRDESKLYKQAKWPPKQDKPAIKKSGKRKHIDTNKNTTLEKFFKPKQESPGSSLDNTELCTECNKRINIDDFTSHLDYHIAKKIHLEINSNGPCARETLKNNKGKVSKRDNVHSGSSILSFFKSEI